MQTDWHTTVNCAVLPHITSNTPTSKLDISTWMIPTNIKLADEQFNLPGAIDKLIGAGLYELLLPSRKTRIGHPVLQESTWLDHIREDTTSQQSTHTSALIPPS